MERPRPTAGVFAPPVTVRYEAETAAPVVVRDARVDRPDTREVAGVEVAVEPGTGDGVRVLVAGPRGEDGPAAVVDELVRRIEYDAAMDAYYRVAAHGGRSPVDFRRYLGRLERDLGRAAVEVATDGFLA